MPIVLLIGMLVVVFQPIPTLLSGFTVKSRELWTAGSGVAACPGELTTENKVTSRRPTVAYRILKCDEEAND